MVDTLTHTNKQIEDVGVVVQEGAAINIVIE